MIRGQGAGRGLPAAPGRAGFSGQPPAVRARAHPGNHPSRRAWSHRASPCSPRDKLTRLEMSEKRRRRSSWPRPARSKGSPGRTTRCWVPDSHLPRPRPAPSALGSFLGRHRRQWQQRARAAQLHHAELSS